MVKDPNWQEANLLAEDLNTGLLRTSGSGGSSGYPPFPYVKF